MKPGCFHPSKIQLHSDKSNAQQGLTLIEIVFAMAIFIVILGATAQGLIYSYTALAVQQQRTSAANDCLAVLAALRRLSYHAESTDACSANDPLFPCVLLEWVDRFPDDFETALEDSEIFEIYGQFFSLLGQTFDITIEDEDGNAAVSRPILSQNTNPVFVTVTTSWTGMRGREYTVIMNSVLTDR